MSRIRLVLPFILLVLSGCKARSVDSVVRDQEAIETARRQIPRPTQPQNCVALRGNGNYINAHFAGLARFVRHFGPADGASGGSSGTVSMFLYESMYSNPVTWNCGEEPCDQARAGLRFSLMLKSLHGYMDVVANSDEAIAIRSVQGLAGVIQQRVSENPGVSWEQIIADTPLTLEQMRALVTILQSDDLKQLINPEFVALARDESEPGRAFRAREVQQGLANPINWDVGPAEDKTVFLRPGLANFEGFANLIGKVGDFYASRGASGNPQQLSAWLDRCAEATANQEWWGGIDQTECGQSFAGIVRSFRSGYRFARGNRVDDAIGEYMPAIGVTSVLAGEEASVDFNGAKEKYRRGEQAPGFGMNPKEQWLRVGVWANNLDMARVSQVTQNNDEKSRRFMDLGQSSWREVLKYSPAEPGLANAQIMGPQSISIGGWPDLHPVQVLKSLGCENVTYITRRDEESKFSTGLAMKVRVTQDQLDRWFSLAPEFNSSFKQALKAADGIWCTNWNATEANEFAKRSKDAWAAPFYVKPNRFANIDSYEGATDSTEGAPLGCF